MKIHLNRAGQSLGQFTPGEVRAGFKEGRFTASDLAWRDGMPMWKPLGEVIDEIAPEDAGGAEAGMAVPAQDSSAAFPWENRVQMGFFNALIETIRMVLLESTKAFRSMPPTGGFGAPLFFFVLCSTVGTIAVMCYQMAFSAVSQASPAMSDADRMVAEAFSSPLTIGMTIVIMPIIFIAGAFISAGISHLALMLVGGAKKPYEATFRVLSYAGGASAILQLIPVCGGFVMWIWSIVLMVIGLSEVHGIGKGRALIAVLLPVIICCGLISMAVFLALGGTLAALLQSVGH